MILILIKLSAGFCASMALLSLIDKEPWKRGVLFAGLGLILFTLAAIL